MNPSPEQASVNLENTATMAFGEATQESCPGSVLPLIPGYHLLRELGRGGMGIVYEAEQVNSGRVVALKIMNTPFPTDEARERFLREGRLAASITHPHSVFIYGVEEAMGRPVIAMELVVGGSLSARVRSEGPMKVETAVGAITQVIEGLEAALDAGVLHRDVKPGNCFVETDGSVKIGDFGLARSTAPLTTEITEAGAFLGTPAYASPEQLQGFDLDARSDIYSVGATLYFLLTGRPPFIENNLIRLVAAVVSLPPDPPSTLRPDISSELSAIILCCLAKKPAERYKNYQALHAALDDYNNRQRQLQPLSILPRMCASLVDTAVYYPLFLFPMIWGFGQAGYFDNAWWLALCQAVLIGCLESLWGTSVGKWVLKGAVRTAEGTKLSLWRGVIRSSLYWAPAALGKTKYAWVALLWPLLLFAFARKSNGWQGLHDRLAGGRVVRLPDTPVHSRIPVQPIGEPELDSSTRTFGPFQFIKEISHGGDRSIAESWDPLLRRRVWISYAAATTGIPPLPLPAARRENNHPSRLRWMGGSHSSAEMWDVFESPAGPSLAALPRQPWNIVQSVLLDLLEDAKANPAFVSSSLEHIWFRSSGHAVIVDFLGETPAGRTPGGVSALLKEVVSQKLDTTQPLPVHAARIISKINSEDPHLLAEIERELTLSRGRGTRVTPLRRIAQILGMRSSAIVLFALGLLATSTMWHSLTLVAELSGLHKLRGDDRDLLASLLREEFASDQALLHQYEQLPSFEQFHPEIEAILTAKPFANAEARERAKKLKQARDRPLPSPWDAFLLASGAAWLSAEILNVLLILIMGSPPSMGVFGLALVRARDGLPAPRWLAATASAIRLSLGALPFAVHATDRNTVFGVEVIILVCVLVWACRNPYRSPLEILTGTAVVRE